MLGAGEGGAGSPGGTPTAPDRDDDYLIVTLLAAGLHGIREQRRRLDAGETPGRPSADDGLLPASWRAGMVRLWWRFHRAGVEPPRSDLEMLALCRRPFSTWPVPFDLSDSDRDASLIEGEELGPFGEQALRVGVTDVEAELVENRVYRELKAAAEANGADDLAVQDNYAALRRFLIEHAVISEQDARRLTSRYPASAANGQAWVLRLIHAAYVRHASDGDVTVLECSSCGNVAVAAAEPCPTPGCTGTTARRVLRTLGGYHLQHRGTRRFIHDPGLVELRVIDRIRAEAPPGRLHVEEWPGLDAYDLRVSFCDARGGRPRGVWGADAKDQVSPRLLARGLSWPPDPPCDRRYLVLPMHRARPGYMQDLRRELEGRVDGVRVRDEETFVAEVLAEARR